MLYSKSESGPPIDAHISGKIDVWAAVGFAHHRHNRNTGRCSDRLRLEERLKFRPVLIRDGSNDIDQFRRCGQFILSRHTLLHLGDING